MAKKKAKKGKKKKTTKKWPRLHEYQPGKWSTGMGF